jgi:hypothetical protein
MNLIDCYLCNKQFDPNKRKFKNKSKYISKHYYSLKFQLNKYEDIDISKALDIFCSKNCINKYSLSTAYQIRYLEDLKRELNIRKRDFNIKKLLGL